MTDHALLLTRTLGLRPPSNADLPFMIEAAAQSARSTDHGQTIVPGVIAAVRAVRIIFPAPAVIERTAIAGRARALDPTLIARDVGLDELDPWQAKLIDDPPSVSFVVVAAKSAKARPPRSALSIP
jgi:hypothetical protein